MTRPSKALEITDRPLFPNSAARGTTYSLARHAEASEATQIMDDEDGFTVALTPAQFAAALGGGTWEQHSCVYARAVGGIRVVIGGLEALAAAALFVVPEPTMLTKAGGWALLAHASDQTATGSRQLWTGREQTSITSDAVTALAHNLGVDEATARSIGENVDMLVPVPLLMLRGASIPVMARVSAVRSGRFSLASHEATTIGAGGHTIAKHVGQSEAQLAARLAAEPRLRRVSTFSTVVEAENVIADAFRLRYRDIIAWARTAGTRPEGFNIALSRPVGKILDRGGTALYRGAGVRIVIKKQVFNGKQFYLLTAFPIP